ncbi:NADPH:quinone reductase-like Zn-dependent oxidoreductase [Roseiarcus fermentans]|uniref:NADPH:quinone reductase-like Zn-dependent oxidoreductase n=1 Tax=Roseiarcus fermentans TaxID=1473586 RepID=A0A366EJC9_9HYPH|nr:NAD(P)-dependent alcohol dehydrogenase [Roseiarcus fermentans]RBP02458.1 NADPH:quinone reductase-like Zn-dependent oxidoreductase [Roseiarcus fermentans]
MVYPLSAKATQCAVVQSRYGSAGAVLAWRSDVPVVAPSITQVQIEIRAASVNPIDWQMIEGNRRMIARRSFPFVPLFDLSGIVTAVGASVETFKVGDFVHCDNKLNGGGASQVVNVEQDLVCLAPPRLSFAEAAAIPLAGQTALLALDQAQVGVGDSLCVVGASGGVGSFVVQMAKALGVSRVVAVCSARNEAFARSLGADAVLDYTSRAFDVALAVGSMDAVIDCAGGKAQWFAARRVLREGGRFVTISRDEDGEVTLGAALRLAPILWRQLQSRFGQKHKYIMTFLDASNTLLSRVDDMVARGLVKPTIERAFEFSAAGVIEALETSRKGRVVGKLVVEMP